MKKSILKKTVGAIALSITMFSFANTASASPSLQWVRDAFPQYSYITIEYINGNAHAKIWTGGQDYFLRECVKLDVQEGKCYIEK